MNIHQYLIATAAVWACALNLSAQTTQVGADRLEAGAFNTMVRESFFGSPTPGSGMLTVGVSNTIGIDNSAAIGQGNQVRMSNALAVGSNNSMGSIDYWSSNSMAVGQGNSSAAHNTLVVGYANTTNYDAEIGGPENSLLVGSLNMSYGKTSVIGGFNNVIYGTDELLGPWASPVSSSAVFGSGLISKYSNCTIVGKNNAAEYTPAGQSPPLFVVGNGASTAARSDALIVKANGDIIITKPQGDISMGIYE